MVLRKNNPALSGRHKALGSGTPRHNGHGNTHFLCQVQYGVKALHLRSVKTKPSIIRHSRVIIVVPRLIPLGQHHHTQALHLHILDAGHNHICPILHLRPFASRNVVGVEMGIQFGSHTTDAVGACLLAHFILQCPLRMQKLGAKAQKCKKYMTVNSRFHGKMYVFKLIGIERHRTDVPERAPVLCVLQGITPQRFLPLPQNRLRRSQ